MTLGQQVTITIAPRDDGGLRVWSDDEPGLILSGPDPQAVMAGVLPALSALRAYKQAKAMVDRGE